MKYYTPISILVWLALIVLGILVKENDRIAKKQKTILYFTYIVVALAAFAEWLGVQLNGNTDCPPWVLMIVKLFDYCLTPIAGGAIILQFTTNSIWKKVIFALISFNTLYQIISCFTGWMLVIDSDNHYSHGPGYIVYIIVYMLIVVFAFFEFGIYGNNFRRQNRTSLFSIAFFCAVGIVMQELLGSEVRTAYITLTIGLTMLFIHYSEFSQLASDDRINEQMIRISEDALTGISSRYAYTAAMRELAALPSLPQDLIAFSIDINGLKNVNDNLGHNAGDELICGAADCISSVFGEYGDCYRTGGDEFIVLIRNNEDMIPTLESKLKQAAADWHGKKVASLSLSVGSAAVVGRPKLTAEKLVAIADREMYKEKNEYYIKNGLAPRTC